MINYSSSTLLSYSSSSLTTNTIKLEKSYRYVITHDNVTVTISVINKINNNNNNILIKLLVVIVTVTITSMISLRYLLR